MFIILFLAIVALCLYSSFSATMTHVGMRYVGRLAVIWLPGTFFMYVCAQHVHHITGQ